MLEHQKKVIEGVSFNKILFEKEVVKSLQWLSASEQDELQIWLFKEYYLRYGDVIKQIFEKISA